MTLTAPMMQSGASENTTRKSFTMTTLARTESTRDPRWRLLIWGVPAALLALPAVAMRFTSEVQWTASDFVVMGVMLALTAGAVDALTARNVGRTGGFAQKLAGVLVAFGLFLLVWVNLAVGMIGDEGDPANLAFAAVIAVIVGGGFVIRLRPAGMATTMLAAAALQAAIGGLALALGWGAYGRGWPMDVIGTTGIFTLLWLAAAALFRVAR